MPFRVLILKLYILGNPRLPYRAIPLLLPHTSPRDHSHNHPPCVYSPAQTNMLGQSGKQIGTWLGLRFYSWILFYSPFHISFIYIFIVFILFAYFIVFIIQSRSWRYIFDDFHDAQPHVQRISNQILQTQLFMNRQPQDYACRRRGERIKRKERRV